ncbi:MAG: accessory regulator AgrB [Firmicutes bacterium]|nr:accessory regulator AgrB [Bacillota bacterium]
MSTIYEQTIEKWAETLSQQMHGNKQDNQAVISYAINILLFNSMVLLIVVLLSLFLGVFSTTMVALAACGSLRIFTGGYHSLNPLHCLIISTVLLVSCGKIAIVLAPGIDYYALLAVLSLIMLLALYFTLKNAPMETPNRPIKPEKRPRLRKKGLVVWSFWMVTLVVLAVLNSGAKEFILAIGLGIAIQTLSLSGLIKNK